MTDPESAAPERSAVFAQHRPLLFSIAYRMLGTSAGAEDIVQEAYLRWQAAGAVEVRSPKDYLSATVTRLSIDHLRSARVRREVYVGPWLPEPLVGIDDRNPLADATLAESLSTAFLVLLERLTPTQRAAFLLREVFEFEYDEVARMLETTGANARQLVQRAKQHIARARPRFESDRQTADDLAHRFLNACETGETHVLVTLLSEQAVAYADGGGKFAAARNPILGVDRVARFVAGIVSKWRASGAVRVEAVSGGRGLVFHAGGRLRAVMTVATGASGLVEAVFVMVNPDKLSGGSPIR
jgi:RNA polymerase sigma-70 factor (ECF subfamily)